MSERTDSRPPARRRRAVLAIAGLAALALLYFLFARPPRTPPEPTSSAPEAPSATAPRTASGPTAARPSGAAPLAGDGGAPDFDPSHGGDFMTAPNLPPHPVQYPPGSQPLTQGTDPSTQPREENPVDAKTGIQVSFGPRVGVVHPPDPLVIDLEVTNKLGARLPIQNGVARFRADKTTAEAGPWYSAPFVDDGSGKDVAGDHSYTATYVPSSAEQAAFFKGGAHVFVEVRFDAPNGLGPRTYATVMQYGRKPNGALNGQYSDDIVGGSLVVKAGVTVKEAGDYRLIASLYGPGGEQAIAFASKAVHLDKGDGDIPLLFFGKILYDKGIDGPYELRYLMLFEEILGVDVIPGETVDHAYTTKPYRARSFSPDAYVAPAPTYEVVDMNSPSQRDKPPPLYSPEDRTKRAGTAAPFNDHPAGPSGDTKGK